LIGSALRPSLGAGVGPYRGRSVATSEILGPASAHRRPEWKRTRKGLLNPTQRASFPRSNVSRQSEGRATIPESRQGGLAGMGRPGLPPESGPPPCGCLRGNPAGSPIRGDLWTMRRSGEPNGTPVSVQRAFRVFLPTHQPGQSRSCPRGGRAARRALRRFPSSRGAYLSEAAYRRLRLRSRRVGSAPSPSPRQRPASRRAVLPARVSPRGSGCSRRATPQRQTRLED